jgi:hypothetical protein
MDIIDFALILTTGFFIGRAYTYWTLYQALKELAEAEGLDLSDELQKIKEKHLDEDEGITVIKVVPLQIESHGNLLYLFERETDKFICQGSTIEELAKLAKDNKNIITASVTYGEKVFMFINGTSKEYVK